MVTKINNWEYLGVAEDILNERSPAHPETIKALKELSYHKDVIHTFSEYNDIVRLIIKIHEAFPIYTNSIKTILWRISTEKRLLLKIEAEYLNLSYKRMKY